jgi:hypothetical protein
MSSRAAYQTLQTAASVLMIGIAAVTPASAHDKKAVGPVHLVIGWGTEPAVSGSRNSIDVDVVASGGKPAVDATGPLSVQVTFGDQNVLLPLLPSGDRPGRYRAWIVPTRAGTYTFHISGTVKGQSIEISSTCSSTTFDCVVDGTDLQFPAKDPSPAQLADRFNRSLPRAERAIDAATRAWWMSLAAIVFSAGALVAIGLNALKRGRARG